MNLLNIGETNCAKVVKRPSKNCKTPYVADIILNTDDVNTEDVNTEFLGHTPCLGCCGLVEKECEVITEIMQDCVSLEVPSVVDAELGPSWGQAKQTLSDKPWTRGVKSGHSEQPH